MDLRHFPYPHTEKDLDSLHRDFLVSSILAH